MDTLGQVHSGGKTNTGLMDHVSGDLDIADIDLYPVCTYVRLCKATVYGKRKSIKSHSKTDLGMQAK